MSEVELRLPDSIDVGWSPSRRVGLGTGVIGSETIVYSPVTGMIHWFNPTAGILWDLCDGSAPVAEIVEDLAVAYEVEPGAIEADVLAVVRDFGEKSLLAGVRGTAICPDCGDPFEAHHERVAPSDRPEAVEPVAADRVEYALVPDTDCQQTLDAKPWCATTAVQIGSVRFGIRSSLPEVDRAVRAALAAYVVDDALVAPNFSLIVHRPNDVRGAPREFHRLHEAWITRTHSLDARVIFECLFDLLGGHLPDPSDQTIGVDAVVLVGSDRAVLLPSSWADFVAGEERRFQRQGFRIAWAPRIDPVTGGVMTLSNRLAVDRSALEELAPVIGPVGGSDPRRSGSPGVRPVAAVVLEVEATAEPVPARVAVPALLDMIGDRHRDDPQALIAAVSAVATTASLLASPPSYVTRRELRSFIEDLLGDPVST